METKTTNSKAIWSFVLSIIGLFFAGIIFGIISLVMGNNAMNEIDPEKEEGYGLAKAGKIIGIIDIIGGILGILFIFAS